MAVADSPLLALSGRFWRWWTGELRALVPARVRLTLARWRRTLALHVGDGEWTLSLHRGERRRELGSLPPADADPETAGTALREMIRGTAGSYDALAVRVPASRALHRTTHLPRAVRGNLVEAVGYDMDRQTPFTADEVYYAVADRGPDTSGEQIVTDLEVVRRADVDPALAALTAAGFTPDRVEVAGGGTGNLLPPEMRPDRGGPARRLTALAAAVALVLGTAAAYLPIHQLQTELARTERKLETVKRQAETVQALRSRAETLRARASDLVTRKQQQPMVTELVAELTRTLPYSAFLSTLQVDRQQVTLKGYARNASTLIGQLANMPQLTNVRFAAPVTEASRVAGVRVHIVADMAGPAGGAS
ncbi:general secretion pathway protein L [Limimonas halophila]|uniref:General secretion pathway protein L n=1 Tax=Limimonas halophila TaxID=1082479 RepID=A0A1G7UTU1_9PROT|nr:PilN domain-containing protein [Limimonas halophila]SDG51025.1 general secretion pathway protein L [Limimonas halophila]